MVWGAGALGGGEGRSWRQVQVGRGGVGKGDAVPSAGLEILRAAPGLGSLPLPGWHARASLESVATVERELRRPSCCGSVLGPPARPSTSVQSSSGPSPWLLEGGQQGALHFFEEFGE